MLLALAIGLLLAAPPYFADDAGHRPPPSRHKVGDKLTDPTGKRMVFIPPGAFTMGRNHGYDKDERPAHPVRLTRGFWLDQTDVTRGEFAASVKAGQCVWPRTRRKNPIRPKPGGSKGNWGQKYCGLAMFWDPPDHPLECVDYNEARFFCEEWRGGRLPTEAEWEWAARGGQDEPKYPWGNDPPSRTLARFGVYSGTVPVASYRPNGYQLFDMAGNVWEWTDDWYDRHYYSRSPEKDPRGPCPGESKCRGFQHRTMRGGGWMTGPTGMRITYRNHHKVWNRFTVVGVRCARDL